MTDHDRVMLYIEAAKRTASAFAVALKEHWPNKDEHPDAERNLTSYLGFELRNNGFQVYF